jgi:hypothetical protein
MVANVGRSRVALSLLLLFLLASLCVAQSTPPTPATIVLEIGHTDMRGFYMETRTARVFSDGRCIAEGNLWKKTKHGHLRKVSVRVEARLEAEEMAELVKLAEQPEFLAARPEYIVPSTRAYPSWVTITYRSRGREKRVKVIDLDPKSVSGAARDAVPSVLLELVEEIDLFLD